MEMRESIRAMTEKMLEMDENTLGCGDSFMEHDMDSFIAIQLVAMLENEYDIMIPDERIADLTSVNAAVKIVKELKNG